MFNKLLATLIVVSTFAFPAKAGLINVDMELQLLVDVSGSIDSQEYALQTQGYADAFRSDEVIESMLAGENGSIAVQYIEWSGFYEQQVQLDWFLIDSIAAANEFADMIFGLNVPSESKRAFGLPDADGIRRGATAIGRAIRFGVAEFENNFFSDYQVIDISGDGVNNSGSGANSTPESQRDRALDNGIDQINAIVVGDDSVHQHYQDSVIGGDDSFLIPLDSMTEFGEGIKKKLTLEISAATISVPEAPVLAFLALGLLAMASQRRTKK